MDKYLNFYDNVLYFSLVFSCSFLLYKFIEKVVYFLALTYGEGKCKLGKKKKAHVFCLRATKLFIFQWERECFDETQSTNEFCHT